MISASAQSPRLDLIVYHLLIFVANSWLLVICSCIFNSQVFFSFFSACRRYKLLAFSLHLCFLVHFNNVFISVYFFHSKFSRHKCLLLLLLCQCFSRCGPANQAFNFYYFFACNPINFFFCCNFSFSYITQCFFFILGRSSFSLTYLTEQEGICNLFKGFNLTK